MKKRKLKNSIKLYLTLAIIGAFLSSLVLTNSLLDVPEEITHTPSENNEVKEVIKETVEEVKVPSKPYLKENVEIAKSFYNTKDDEEKQINSLIYYKNTYMQNTGILYKSNEQFDVVSSLDGTVTSITKDDILGNVVEITHNTNLITIYHCLSEVSVKAGDKIKQNDVIGTSGKVNIDNTYENALLFEVNYKGKTINPEEYYQMKEEDLSNNA